MKFDSPFSNLGFYGSPNHNNVFILPTAYCLVSIIEKPFFVIFYEDIEFVSIERIDNKIKSFDLAFIFKDYTRPIVTIDNIPKDNLT
jgi:nucleosome binding factor SPN SPT16 subunit